MQRLGDERSPADEFIHLRGFSGPTADFNYRCHISLKNKYMYLLAPKVACTYILGILDLVERINLCYNWATTKERHAREGSLLLMPDHLPLEEIAKVFFSPEYFRFSFVRHPFARLLSAYVSHFVVRPGHTRDNFVVRHGLPRYENISFRTFIECVTSDERTTMDLHWRPLVELLCDGRVTLDFVGRFECLREDILQLLQKAVPSITLTEVQRVMLEVTEKGVQTSAEGLLGHFYTSDLVRKVECFYYDDFITYGYIPNLELTPLFSGGARSL